MSQTDNDLQLTLTTLIINSDLGCVREPEDKILEAVKKNGFSEEAMFAIKLTLEEAITNAIKHGNCCDTSKKVTIRYHCDAHQLVVYVKDEGRGFDPQDVPDPTQPDRLALPSGRGILLMKAYMNEVKYLSNGRELYIRKLNDDS